MEHHVKEPNHDGKRKAFLSPKIKPFTTKWRKTHSWFSAIFTFFSYKNAPFLPHQVQEIPIFVLDIVFLNKKTLSTLLTTINLSINLSS